MQNLRILLLPAVLLVLLVSPAANAQNYSAYQAVFAELRALSSAPENEDVFWQKLKASRRIPLVVEDSVAFFYRGVAGTVDWMGDFNGWGSRKNFNNKGVHVPNTSIWYLKASFPQDARLDYKIVLNGGNWVLDPENIRQQWSGVGGGSPNSELTMPRWKQDPMLTQQEGIAHGKLSDDILIFSTVLGYQITYRTYIPAGVAPDAKLRSLYVTDGYEYIHPQLGNMVTILDNLIAAKKIQPVCVIFIDQREPVNRGNNKRMDELAMNPKYLTFFTDEFIPLITKTCPVKPDSPDRAIMGSSMGGLNAAYFAFSKAGVFGMAGIQSPAFWIRPQIYTLCDNPSLPVKVSMTSGVISDASEGSRRMKEILQTNACQYTYHEVNDGHSWGNWRNLIDDILVDLFPYAP